MQKESIMAKQSRREREKEAAAGEAASNERPEEPVDVVVHSGSKQVVITWPDVEGALSYNLYAGVEAEFGESNGTKTERVKSGAIVDCAPGVPQFFRVTAVNPAGESGPSLEVTGCSHQ
jgi:hypothetical protein